MKSVYGHHIKSGWTSSVFFHFSPLQTKLRMTLESTFISFSFEQN